MHVVLSVELGLGTTDEENRDFKLDLSVGWMTILVDRANVPARRYLERFGFEQIFTDGDEDEEFRTLCIRRQI